MIAIVAATRKELSGFLKEAAVKKQYFIDDFTFLEATLRDVPVLVVITGVGARKAASAVKVMLQRYSVKIIISAGFAGALRESLQVGDVITGTYSIPVNGEEKYRLFNYEGLAAPGIYTGEILTSNSFVNCPDKKADLASRYPALCVDMETRGVAKQGEKSGIAVMAIRVISDGYTTSLPDMGKIFNRNSALDTGKAAVYFLKNPVDLYRFIRFYHIDLAKAERVLSDFLKQLVPEIYEITQGLNN